MRKSKNPERLAELTLARATGRLIKGYRKEANNRTSGFEAFHVGARSIEGFGSVKARVPPFKVRCWECNQ